jgi:hypothetical protein
MNRFDVLRESAGLALAITAFPLARPTPFLAQSEGGSSRAPASTRAIFALDLTVPLLQPVVDVAARYGLLRASFPASELIAQL